jgi:glycosyltransferase involved in cell wall biosynthesis
MTEGMSVIVCAFNGEARMDRFVRPIVTALDAMEFPGEVVVVDDGSSDGTAGAARRAGARVVSHERNLGPAVARNTGALAARFPWLLYCDDDLELGAETLIGLWRARDADACIVPEIRGPDGRLQNAYTSDWRWGDLKLDGREEPVGVIAYPMSACLLVSAAQLHNAGGFDERFRIYYEDSDAGFALARAGVVTRMAAGLVTIHHEHGAGGNDPERQRRIEQRVFEGRWRFAMTALVGRRRALSLALGLPRTALQSVRVGSADPLRGYWRAMRDIRRMLQPRERHDLRHRSG